MKYLGLLDRTPKPLNEDFTYVWVRQSNCSYAKDCGYTAVNWDDRFSDFNCEGTFVCIPRSVRNNDESLYLFQIETEKRNEMISEKVVTKAKIMPESEFITDYSKFVAQTENPDPEYIIKNEKIKNITDAINERNELTPEHIRSYGALSAKLIYEIFETQFREIDLLNKIADNSDILK